MMFRLQTDDWTAQLYRYDSATNQAQGPVKIDSSCTNARSMTLVPGKPGSPSPACGLLSMSNAVSELDLSPELYGLYTSFNSNEQILFQVDGVIEGPKPDMIACRESCENERFIVALLGGIIGAIAVVMICGYCARKRQREQALTDVTVVGPDEVLLDEMEEQPQQLPS